MLARDFSVRHVPVCANLRGTAIHANSDELRGNLCKRADGQRIRRRRAVTLNDEEKLK